VLQRLRGGLRSRWQVGQRWQEQAGFCPQSCLRKHPLFPSTVPQLFPLSNIKTPLSGNMYELPVYKRKPEAAILKPYTNMDFRD